jgi:hypothetical protein
LRGVSRDYDFTARNAQGSVNRTNRRRARISASVEKSALERRRIFFDFALGR